MINVKNLIKFILINNIVFIEASRDYTNLILSDGKSYLTSRPMLEWEERLPTDNFRRVHRSYIVNFDFKVDSKAMLLNTPRSLFLIPDSSGVCFQKIITGIN